MRPTLSPGDGLLTLRDDNPRRGQLRVFRDPTMSSRWLVKRVGDVYRGERSATFEARSDNPDAPGASIPRVRLGAGVGHLPRGVDGPREMTTGRTGVRTGR